MTTSTANSKDLKTPAKDVDRFDLVIIGGGAAAYERVDQPVLKERIVRVVAENGSPADRVWLQNIASDSQEPTNVRERAVRLLGESRATSGELAELYDEIDNRTVRERLLRILGNIL